MKLYATVTSERASKSQGGKEIRFMLQNEKQACIMEMFVTVEKDNAIVQDFYVGDMNAKEIQEWAIRSMGTCAHCGDNMYTTVRAHHHTENGEDVTQGKKCECGNYPYTDAGTCTSCCDGYKCTYGCGTCFCDCHSKGEKQKTL